MTTQTITPLEQIHTDFDSAYVVENYPYGGLRTQMKFWIETKKDSQRVVSCSLNPKTGKWNKPHAGTYEIMKVLFIDETTGHVESDGINQYNFAHESAGFLEKYGSVLSVAQKNQLTVWKTWNEVQEVQGIRRVQDGAEAFYTAVNETLRSIGREDLVKEIKLFNSQTGETKIIK